MRKDELQVRYLSVPYRFADFFIVGIENQEEVHYLMPLRVMGYDVSEYEHQASLIRKEVRKEKGLGQAEYLSGFKKDSKLLPCITFVLYYGKEWDGSKDMHGLLDFSDLPEELVQYVTNYPIHIVEIRKLENTDVFKTDLKLVFDFIKYSEDKQKLRQLVTGNEAYKSMDEDAYDMAIAYTKSEKYIGVKEYNKEEGKVNMCKALEDWAIEERTEGRLEGIQGMIFENIEENIPLERIILKLKKYFGLEEEEAGRLINACVAQFR